MVINPFQMDSKIHPIVYIWIHCRGLVGGRWWLSHVDVKESFERHSLAGQRLLAQLEASVDHRQEGGDGDEHTDHPTGQGEDAIGKTHAFDGLNGAELDGDGSSRGDGWEDLSKSISNFSPS